MKPLSIFLQGSQPQGNNWQFLAMMSLLFVVFYFFMIRPQQKKAKEHQAMLAALAKGDEVVTGGGIAGRVAKIGENYVSVEVSEGVEVQVQKPAIALVLPKGTLKGL